MVQLVVLASEEQADQRVLGSVASLLAVGLAQALAHQEAVD